MTDKELRIAKISQLLNTAIRSKNSEDYNKALSLLQTSEPKPTLKQVLDAQVADNKRIKEEARKKEEIEDQIRLEKNRLALESQQRKDSLKKNEAFKELKQSWNENINLKELKKELGNIEYDDVENNEKIDMEIEDNEEKRLEEVIKRYEKMFGRIKGLDTKRSNPGSAAGKSIVSSVAQTKKSKLTEFSTVSQKEAYEKLKQLDLEEEKIKKEKEDLLKFLELRSTASKTSSRPTTVASLAYNKPEIQSHQQKPKELPIISESPKRSKKTDKKEQKIESIDELFKNLY